MNPSVGDFVLIPHLAKIGRIKTEYVYEWDVEFLDGTSLRFEADDMEPVSTEVLWILSSYAPPIIRRATVRAANME